MKQAILVFSLTAAAFVLAACGSPASDGAAAGTADAPAPIEPKIDDDMNLTAKPQGPVRFSYRVIGTPVVGQPVIIDLVVESNVGEVQITLN